MDAKADDIEKNKALWTLRRALSDDDLELFRTKKYRVAWYRGVLAVIYKDSQGKRKRVSLGTTDLTRARELAAHVASGYRGNRTIQRPHTIYFIRSLCPEGFIKIGMTSNTQKRLDAIRIGNPYDAEILATIPGTRRIERELHERFQHLHHRGEWFRPGQELLAFIGATDTYVTTEPYVNGTSDSGQVIDDT